MAALSGLPLLLLLLCSCCQCHSVQYGGSSWIMKYLGCCIHYPHNIEGYVSCCKTNQTCDQACPMWSPLGKGCHHKGEWFPIGAVMETNAKKCLNVKCCPHNGEGCHLPYAEQEAVGDNCNCCEYNGILYDNKDTIHVGSCTRWKCRRGVWIVAKTPKNYEPCPPGYTPFRESCIVVEPLWLTWSESEEFCRLKGGRLLPLPDEERPTAEEQQFLTEELRSCDGSWVIGSKNDDGLCPGIPPGSDMFAFLSCQMRLRPECIFPKLPCDQEFCTVNGTRYKNDTVIEEIDECVDIVCLNGYAITRIQESCCSAEASDGIDIVPSGATFGAGGKACQCQNGNVTCCLPDNGCGDMSMTANGPP